jgi:hypothetical protein
MRPEQCLDLAVVTEIVARRARVLQDQLGLGMFILDPARPAPIEAR